MFSNNQKITNKQLKKMLIFDIISISIIILPGIVAGNAGKDGLIAIILGSLGAIIYSMFFLYVSGKINGEYMEFSMKGSGKFLTFIFGILYLLKFLLSCWITLSLFTKVIKDTLLPDTSIKVISLSLILVSIYVAGKGIEVRARMTEIFFYIVIIPLIVLIAFGLRRVELTNLLPLFTTGSSEIMYTSYFVLLTYTAIELLMFAVPSLTSTENKRERPKYMIQVIAITMAVNLALFILVLGLLGSSGFGKVFKSSIMVMQLIQFPGGFVQRLDAVMLTIWMLSTFTGLSAYIYYLSKITNSIIGIKSKNYSLVFYGTLLFLLSFVKIPFESLFYYFGKYMAYIGLPQSICIPLVILAISKLRAGKGETHEQKSH